LWRPPSECTHTARVFALLAFALCVTHDDAVPVPYERFGLSADCDVSCAYVREMPRYGTSSQTPLGTRYSITNV
jgi:hypothetical protein